MLGLPGATTACRLRPGGDGTRMSPTRALVDRPDGWNEARTWRHRSSGPRRGHVAASLLGLLVLLPVGLGWVARPDGFVVYPFLQHVTGDSAVVTWETAVVGTTEVFVGTGEPLERVVCVEGTRTLHRVRLADLEAGQRWFYRVRTRTASGAVIESDIHAFSTAPCAEAPLTVAVVGYTQDQPWIWRQVASRIEEERPQLLVHCGDLVGLGQVKREWTEEFFDPARRLLASVPLQSVLGNHEEDADHWYRYTAHPRPAYCYSFTFGAADFFMLDSNRRIGVGSEQHGWLEEALAASTARWRFVVLHHPPYTSDVDDYGDGRRERIPCGDPRTTDLVALIEKHAVDVVFYGHIHAYERSWPLREGRIDHEHGTVYVQTGGGGGYLEHASPGRTWHAAKLRRAHHYCTLTLAADQLELRAYDIEGRLFDQVARRARPRRGKPAGMAPTTARATPRSSAHR